MNRLFDFVFIAFVVLYNMSLTFVLAFIYKYSVLKFFTTQIYFKGEFLSEKKIDVNSYVLDDSYKPEQVEYDEEIDGNFFPDRDDHLKKKENARDKYKDIKNSMATTRVRR